jgi:hypothetical protein
MVRFADKSAATTIGFLHLRALNPAASLPPSPFGIYGDTWQSIPASDRLRASGQAVVTKGSSANISKLTS